MKLLKTTALLALAASVLSASPAMASTVTAKVGDMILTIQGTNITNAALVDLEVDLGSASLFYNAAPGTSFALSGLLANDLTTIFGDWTNRTDLSWGVAASTNNIAGTSDGAYPAGTLWGTSPTTPGNTGTPFVLGSQSAQLAAVNKIKGLFSGTVAQGNLNGATATTNGGTAAVIGGNLINSWSKQEGHPGASVSFGYFNPTIMAGGNANVAGPTIPTTTLSLYQLTPNDVDPTTYTGKPGETLLGQFSIDSLGAATFTAAVAVPEPTGFALLGLGATFFGITRRRSTRKVEA